MLEKKRENPVVNKDIIDPEERMKDLLFRNNNYAETRKVIRDLWVLRNQMLKELEKLTRPRKTGQDSDNKTVKDSPQDRIVGDQDKDPPIGNPPKSGLLESRILVIDHKDKPRVQSYKQEEINLLQKEDTNSQLENLPKSEPTQNRLQQRIPKSHHKIIHQSGQWDFSTC